MKFVILFLICGIFSTELEASNILAIWPVQSRANFNVGLALCEKLGDLGHKITLISPYDQREPHANINFVKLDRVANAVDVIQFFEMRNFTLFELMKFHIDAARDKVDFAMGDEALKGILKSPESYDIVILDSYLNDAMLGVAHFLKSPVIAFSSTGVSKWSDQMVQNPFNPSYNSNSYLGFTDEMNFYERLLNSAMWIVENLFYHFYYIPSQEALYKEHMKEFLPEPIPKLIDLIHNVDLVLLNSHPLSHPPKAHVPNSVEVGGVHLKTLEDEIHPEFIKVMDRATNGIIYFNLGANIKSSDMPNEKLEVFLKVFNSMIDVLVLWKFETIALKERHGTNIIIGPWLPQQEILNHKNLKVFITQGGYLSTMEALFYGKPIIGMPFFNEQKSIIERSVSQGYGLSLDYDELSEESLNSTIQMIFNNSTFQRNAEKYSAVLKDNPISPIDKAVYYVEHVIRHHGVDHLKVAATKLSFCQLHLIDQITFIAFVLLIAISILSKSIKCFKMKFQKRNKSDSVKNSKRKKLKSN